MKILLGSMQKLSGGWNYEMQDLSGISILWRCTLIVGVALCLGLAIIFIVDKEYKLSFKTVIVASMLLCLGMWPNISLGISLIFIDIGFSVIYGIRCYKSANSYYKSFTEKFAVLDFKTIKSLYDLNPDRFRFNEDSTSCKYRVYGEEGIKFVYICISNPYEYLKYYIWRKKSQKTEYKFLANKNNVEATQLILNQAQCDIEKLRKKAREELKEASSIMEQVQKNMKQEVDW